MPFCSCRDWKRCRSDWSDRLPTLSGLRNTSTGIRRYNGSIIRGSKSSPYYDLGRKYLPKGPGAILTFGIRGGLEQAKRFIEGMKIFSFLANVGDSKSLVVHPATVTHGQLTEAEQLLAGCRPEQIRFSVGTEDVEDLLWDIEQAFQQTGV